MSHDCSWSLQLDVSQSYYQALPKQWRHVNLQCRYISIYIDGADNAACLQLLFLQTMCCHVLTLSVMFVNSCAHMCLWSDKPGWVGLVHRQKMCFAGLWPSWQRVQNSTCLRFCSLGTLRLCTTPPSSTPGEKSVMARSASPLLCFHDNLTPFASHARHSMHLNGPAQICLQAA